MIDTKTEQQTRKEFYENYLETLCIWQQLLLSCDSSVGRWPGQAGSWSQSVGETLMYMDDQRIAL